MSNRISIIKKDMELKFIEFRQRRRDIIARFKKKLEEAKIEQIKNSIFNK